jgi:type II secretory pathway pseudopilin PulG
MSHARSALSGLRCLAACTAVIALITGFSLSLAAQPQEAPAPRTTDNPIAQELNKYPGLAEALGRLILKFQQEVHFPAPRAQSRLLPLLPDSTMSYAAFSNYGDVIQQALDAFHAELRSNPSFRDWWQHGSLAKEGPKIEDALSKLAQLQQFLGEEVVVSGSLEGQNPNLLIVAEIRKPGFKKFLQEMVSELAGGSKSGIRLLDQQELAGAQGQDSPDDLKVLVRSDFVAASLSLAELRNFNKRLDAHSREFASKPFAQRILQEYRDGVTVLGAADLQNLMSQLPPAAKQDAAFQKSGLTGVKYAVWDHKSLSGHSFSQAELSFNSSRRGVGAWLANAGPLHSLEFVSPDPMMVLTIAFSNPARIFDDIKALAGAPSNPNPFPSLSQFEQMLHLSLRDDLLAHLGGELTLELDSIQPPKPVWKALLSVKDAAPVEQTLSTLLSAAGIHTTNTEERGVTYHSLLVPYGQATLEIAYTIAAGQFILSSSRQAVTDAILARKSGASLANSGKLQTALPPGYSVNASALFYQDPIALAAVQLRAIMPELAGSVAAAAGKAPPTIAFVYGEESAIREASTSPAMDVGAVLVVAAIAIPNLLRSKMAANESSAVGSVRTISSAQITYTSTYPQRGYAPDLATLGPDPREPAAYSAHHAGLLDGNLANESCAGNGWCTKSGYRFRVTAVCKKRVCEDYVTVATPVDSNSGTRSFCSTSDAIIRTKPGSVDSPLTVAECKAWQPLQ